MISSCQLQHQLEIGNEASHKRKRERDREAADAHSHESHAAPSNVNRLLDRWTDLGTLRALPVNARIVSNVAAAR